MVSVSARAAIRGMFALILLLGGAFAANPDAPHPHGKLSPYVLGPPTVLLSRRRAPLGESLRRRVQSSRSITCSRRRCERRLFTAPGSSSRPATAADLLAELASPAAATHSCACGLGEDGAIVGEEEGGGQGRGRGREAEGEGGAVASCGKSRATRSCASSATERRSA